MGNEVDTENPYRHLPSVDDVLQSPDVAALAEYATRDVLVGFVQDVLAELRREIQAGSLDASGLAEGLERGLVHDRLAARVAVERRAGLVRAVNATGVVLHTGLGRAPAHPEVAEAMAQVARSYCVLEVERETGERSQRDDRLSELLVRLTGAEAAIAVNNNAGAVVLALSTFAGGRETVLSRGELVEIGGSFRMPDVMERAGTRLVEVGTTNRTRIADYRAALGTETGLLLKVHRSNFRVEGFVEEVDATELAQLGAESGLASVYDLGSGLIEVASRDLRELLADEPDLERAVASGVDVVTFSGDKLFGGPQAGLLVGSRAAVGALRANPLYRALRLDKVALAGLERTVELLLAGRGDELPVRRMLLAERGDLERRAEALQRELSTLPGLEVRCVEEQAQPGSGSAPGVFLAGPAVEVRLASGSRVGSISALSEALRRADPPVFARVRRDALAVDPRSLLDGDEALVVAAFRSATSAR